MSVISGQVTFGSTGPKSLPLGILFTDLDFYAGARPSTIETTGMDSYGHADASNQFCRATTGSKAKIDLSNGLVIYDNTGSIVVEARVTGGWGTTTLQMDCTIANANYPWQLVARTT